MMAPKIRLEVNTKVVSIGRVRATAQYKRAYAHEIITTNHNLIVMVKSEV